MVNAMKKQTYRITAFLDSAHTERLMRVAIIIRRLAGIVRTPTNTEVIEFLLDNLPIEELDHATNPEKANDGAKQKVGKQKTARVA